MDILVLNEIEVQVLLDLDLLLDALAEGFRALSNGLVVAPNRNEISVPQSGAVLSMLAHQPGKEITVKLVSAFHDNERLGLPTHEAIICLFDPQTGTPLSILNGTYITAMRTAGASALSTRLLARPDARVLAIIGAGVQGQAHLTMLPRVRDFSEIRIASRNFAHAKQLAIGALNTTAVQSIEQAVQGADVICLCTNSDVPVLNPAWLAPGVHITSVGYRPPVGELDPRIVQQARLFVETKHAFDPPPAGCGELAGLDPAIAVELGQLVQQPELGRQSRDEITVYKAMGHACEDMVTASLIYQQAKQEGAGYIVRL